MKCSYKGQRRCRSGGAVRNNDSSKLPPPTHTPTVMRSGWFNEQECFRFFCGAVISVCFFCWVFIYLFVFVSCSDMRNIVLLLFAVKSVTAISLYQNLCFCQNFISHDIHIAMIIITGERMSLLHDVSVLVSQLVSFPWICAHHNFYLTQNAVVPFLPPIFLSRIIFIYVSFPVRIDAILLQINSIFMSRTAKKKKAVHCTSYCV